MPPPSLSEKLSDKVLLLMLNVPPLTIIAPPSLEKPVDELPDKTLSVIVAVPPLIVIAPPPPLRLTATLLDSKLLLMFSIPLSTEIAPPSFAYPWVSVISDKVKLPLIVTLIILELLLTLTVRLSFPILSVEVIVGNSALRVIVELLVADGRTVTMSSPLPELQLSTEVSVFADLIAERKVQVVDVAVSELLFTTIVAAREGILIAWVTAMATQLR